ncbi:hypothetical protein FFI87_027345 [Burkholderia sp. KBS0801]|nr:hypothetical protein FFI87_027345 [Burkholderia sp. KBS0801]
MRIRPVFAASRASRAAVLVATHARSICKQTLAHASSCPRNRTPSPGDRHAQRRPRHRCRVPLAARGP